MTTAAPTKHLCYNCFAQRTDLAGPCPYCGFDLEENVKKFPVALRAGTELDGRYIVGRVLGQGGFGITYLAFDRQLQAKVAVKEYMPNEIATRIDGTSVSVAMDTKTDDFTYGAERFQEEARTLAKFIGHPNIAGVSSYFDENDTSYFVMDYIEGVSFKSYIANNGGKVSVEETLNVMIPVLRALTAVHAEGFIHRDVTPDNIYISKDGNVKLLDFGSARYSIGDKSKSLDVILKVGYAPKEQYIRRGRQGPYTDVYSCAACFYAALTGFLPPESLERLDADTLVPVSQTVPDIPEWLDKAILKGLAVQPEERFQSAAEFLDAIENQLVVDVPGGEAAVVQPAKKDLKPVLIGAAAAVMVLVVGLGLFGGRGGGAAPGGNGSDGRGYQGEQLLKAEVPFVTIQGRECSTNEVQLDLSGCGLTDADIQDLKYMINLRDLRLDNNQITTLSPIAGLPRLQSLQVKQNRLTDISALAGMETLRYVGLSENPELTDLSPLKGKTEMENLDFYGLSLTDYSFLEGMTKLRYLQFEPSMLEADLSALSTLTGLEQLNINTNGNSGAIPHLDLSFLAGMTGLQSLQVSGQFEELTLPSLDGLTHLKNLRLNNYSEYFVGTPSLEPFRNLTGLQELYFQIDNSSDNIDLSPISGLTELTVLSLRGNVASLQPLAGLSKLERLEVYNGSSNYHALEDLGGLEGMTSLKSLTLNIVGNVKDFTPISHLAKLTSLQLSGQFATEDLSFLSGLTELRELTISGNQALLSSLTGLEDLTQLQTLQIDCQGLASLKGVENLTDLRELNLYGGNSTYTDTAPLKNLINLTSLRLPSRSGTGDGTIDPGGLANLSKIQELEINGKLTGFEPITKMPGLKSFRYYGYYDYNDPGISLAPLASMTGLQELYLSCNTPGADITPIGELTGLRVLNLYVYDAGYKTKIRDLSCLSGLTKLSTLRVSNTVENIDTSPVDFVPDLTIN